MSETKIFVRVFARENLYQFRLSVSNKGINCGLLVKLGPVVMCNSKTKWIYLEQISNVPLLTNHIVVSLAASNFRWLRMNENLLDDKSHSAETVSISILPNCVVVDFVNAINERNLENNKFKSLTCTIAGLKLFTK